MFLCDAHHKEVTMKSVKAEETHNIIIDAARELFEQKSVRRVTVSEITKRAGVAKGTFYLYFESKDALVWHFIEHELDEAMKWFDDIVDCGYTEKDIEGIIEFSMRYIKSHYKSLKIIHQARFFNFLGKKNMEKKYVNTMLQPIYMWLSKGKELNHFHIDDPKFMAYFLLSAIHNMIDQYLEDDSPYSLDEMEKQFKLLLIKLLK